MWQDTQTTLLQPVERSVGRPHFLLGHAENVFLTKMASPMRMLPPTDFIKSAISAQSAGRCPPTALHEKQKTCPRPHCTSMAWPDGQDTTWSHSRYVTTGASSAAVFFDCFYYSVLNFSFFGFGEILPQTAAAKIVTLLEVVLAFFTVIFLLSDFISLKDSLRRERDR